MIARGLCPPSRIVTWQSLTRIWPPESHTGRLRISFSGWGPSNAHNPPTHFQIGGGPFGQSVASKLFRIPFVLACLHVCLQGGQHCRPQSVCMAASTVDHKGSAMFPVHQSPVFPSICKPFVFINTCCSCFAACSAARVCHGSGNVLRSPSAQCPLRFASCLHSETHARPQYLFVAW